MLSKTLIATLMCVIGVAVATNSPVFLWGANSPSKPTLQTVSQSEFAELVKPLLEKSMVVAFQEENLAAHDFTCANKESAGSCYAHLQGVSPKTYYANVENPTEALRSVAATREFNTVSKSGLLETPLSCAPGKVVFVNFDKVSDSPRGDSLEAHDAAISSISKQIACPVVYMYMSSPDSTAAVQSRTRRAAGDVATNATTAAAVAVATKYYVFRSASQFLIYYTKLTITTPTGATNLEVTEMTIKNVTLGPNPQINPLNLFEVSLTGPNLSGPLSFNISLLYSGYFSMGNVMYDGISYRATSMDAPTDFSYFCGNATLNAISPLTATVQNTNVLKWNSLQFQAPFGYTKNATFVFGDAWHCVGFFSPAILGGFLVIVIMLLILFVGICWMMDINTMDRFDDPKGKTITISANE